MNEKIAQVKLMVLQVDASKTEWTDAVVHFTNFGLPPEIVLRLKGLWEISKTIGGHVYEIGKIIVLKIIDFVLANKNMAIGIVIGVAVGSLTNMIPWIGPMLAPLAITIGAFLGAIAGHRLDKLAKGELEEYQNTDLFSDLITIAKEFWKLIAEIFQSLKEYIV